ncbi:unnamed protein product [Somion occarium]|uniref:Peptidase A1 domain-containing protein n=1 Tax=Somion occarium TaxID=3059160 RepID=A0ABP1D7Z7_9APHY
MAPFFLLAPILLGYAVRAASPTWISLNLSVPSTISDVEINANYVDVLVGTPPQVVQLPIDLQTDAIDVYSSDCAFCPGWDFFDPSLSTTNKPNDRVLNGTNLFNGTWIYDTIGFGGIVESPDIDIGLLTVMSTNYTNFRIRNGGLGLLTNTFRKDPINRLIPRLYESGQLIDPVIGMRLDPSNPRLTIGALDPNDYEGTLNWVELEPDNGDWFKYNVFKIDGFSGRNGSLLPFDDNLLTAVDSMYFDISIPNNLTYFNNTNYTGPVFSINDTVDGYNLDPTFFQISYPCNTSSLFPNISVPHPYVDFSVHINGVSYMIDSDDNLLHQPSQFSPNGFCNVGIVSTSDKITTEPQSVLGLPFLRSVYLAYRFPTGSCPGFFGFAFPKGLNRTQAQVSQTPRATPTLSSQCLSLTRPTSTPIVSRPASPNSASGNYAVYGEDGVQVSLSGADLLVKGIWNATF